MSNETNYAPDPKPMPPVLLPSGRRGGAILYRSVSVTGVAQRVLNFDPNRSTAILVGGSSVNIFLDHSSGVSTSSKFQMQCILNGAAPSIEVRGFEEVWAITAGSPSTLCILEVRFR